MLLALFGNEGESRLLRFPIERNGNLHKPGKLYQFFRVQQFGELY
jgi:hypothetical protein